MFAGRTDSSTTPCWTHTFVLISSRTVQSMSRSSAEQSRMESSRSRMRSRETRNAGRRCSRRSEARGSATASFLRRRPRERGTGRPSEVISGLLRSQVNLLLSFRLPLLLVRIRGSRSSTSRSTVFTFTSFPTSAWRASCSMRARRGYAEGRSAAAFTARIPAGDRSLEMIFANEERNDT